MAPNHVFQKEGEITNLRCRHFPRRVVEKMLDGHRAWIERTAVLTQLGEFGQHSDDLLRLGGHLVAEFGVFVLISARF